MQKLIQLKVILIEAITLKLLQLFLLKRKTKSEYKVKWVQFWVSGVRVQTQVYA